MQKNSETGRAGQRQDRKKHIGSRTPKLGYYLILTDTNETEKNYFNGLRDSIPDEYKDHLVVKVEKSKKTAKLVEQAMELSQKYVQYCKPWIVFDRDEVPNFDKLIEEAGMHNIRVGWSNPCIEIWFSAYFGHMPVFATSEECCKKFAVEFKKRTGKIYSKADKNIYSILNQYGSVDKAFVTAKSKLMKHKGEYPSKASPACTVYQLVEEILGKM